MNCGGLLRSKMNKALIILGVVLVIAGIGVAAFYGFTARTRVYGGYGIAIVGVLIAIGGAMMKAPGAAAAGQFACAKCGMKFASQAALDQHTKDKHGM